MKVKITYRIDGEQVSKREYERRKSSRGVAYQRRLSRVRRGKQVGFPVFNDALGVDPSQISESVERNRLHGTGVVYTNDGRAVIHSEEQLRSQMKLDGAIDRRAYY